MSPVVSVENGNIVVTWLDFLIRVELRISAFRQTRWACDSPNCCGVARRYTTDARNTHKTDLREVAYLWHPWHGQRVLVRGEARRGGSVVLRCVPDELKGFPTLEIPEWMFDSNLCGRGWLDNGEPRCIAFRGISVDEAISREVLRVVQPVALEASVLASQELGRQQDDILDALPRDLEAARYAAERAQRQYDASDPENRLVTAELERRWNVALQHVREIEVRIEQHGAAADASPTASLEELYQLSQQLETIWTNPATSVRLKKRLVRTLIEEVLVDVDSAASELVLTLHWKGGAHTALRLPRRRRGQCSTQTSRELIEAVGVLARICSDDLIAGILNRNGHLTGRGNRWTRERVTALRSHHRIPFNKRDEQQPQAWMNLTDAAALLDGTSENPPACH